MSSLKAVELILFIIQFFENSVISSSFFIFYFCFFYYFSYKVKCMTSSLPLILAQRSETFPCRPSICEASDLFCPLSAMNCSLKDLKVPSRISIFFIHSAEMFMDSQFQFYSFSEQKHWFLDVSNIRMISFSSRLLSVRLLSFERSSMIALTLQVIQSMISQSLFVLPISALSSFKCILYLETASLLLSLALFSLSKRLSISSCFSSLLFSLLIILSFWSSKSISSEIQIGVLRSSVPLWRVDDLESQTVFILLNPSPNILAINYNRTRKQGFKQFGHLGHDFSKMCCWELPSEKLTLLVVQLDFMFAPIPPLFYHKFGRLWPEAAKNLAVRKALSKKFNLQV